MQFFFAPFACSLASHIALQEAGLAAEFRQVILGTKRTTSGEDFLAISPKGQVPVLWLDDGTVLTEGPAVLQFIADQRPESGLAPKVGSPERYQVIAWLNFIATEIHKLVFWPTFNPDSPDRVKQFVRPLINKKLDFLAAHLQNREYLVGQQFTIADAYLTWALHLCGFAKISLDSWPVLSQYLERMKQRPHVREAMAKETALMQAAA